MDEEEWMLQELQRMFDKRQDYGEAVFIKAAQDIIEEQGKRIYQMEGEIDGTLWSPKRWGE
ncbi:hypothetical protein SAMN04488072_11478 [Lentibacillus halodurans]|uniref:Uncharacterized protein n=1 Tax=Lentibacillus halodurans TaxID=237679 RepID=A0A1I0ZXR2_9BACI|nr:hypothetical protein [Lentibacillus halodurans]SFB30499.1 hypothetical protein SAMN04488072_11478 [Lentibacillus halodurans]